MTRHFLLTSGGLTAGVLPQVGDGEWLDTGGSGANRLILRQTHVLEKPGSRAEATGYPALPGADRGLAGRTAAGHSARHHEAHHAAQQGEHL